MVVLTGIADRKNFTYAFGKTVRFHVEQPDHPIPRGLADWDLVDETYHACPAGDGSDILITTPCSDSMQTIA